MSHARSFHPSILRQSSLRHAQDRQDGEPADADYDLYVTGGDTCSGAGCSSTSSGNATEQVTVTNSDNFGEDDSFDIDIEVRYFDGDSCSNWTLTVEGTDCL